MLTTVEGNTDATVVWEVMTFKMHELKRLNVCGVDDAVIQHNDEIPAAELAGVEVDLEHTNQYSFFRSLTMRSAARTFDVLRALMVA